MDLKKSAIKVRDVTGTKYEKSAIKIKNIVGGGSGSNFPLRFEKTNTSTTISLDDTDFKDVIDLNITYTGKYVFELLQTIDSSTSTNDLEIQILNGDDSVISGYTFAMRFDTGGANYSSVIALAITDISKPIKLQAKLTSGTATVSKIAFACEKKGEL